MYPNSQRSFFLRGQQQAWAVIGCLGQYSNDPLGYSERILNGHNLPVYEMIRLPSGAHIEGAPEYFGPVVDIVELGVFGSLKTYIVTASRVLYYDPQDFHSLNCVFGIKQGLVIGKKIPGDPANHRFAATNKETGDFAGIVFLRDDDWVLSEADNAELIGFTAVHFAPGERENECARITLANHNGALKQFLLDEFCTTLSPTELKQVESKISYA